MVVISGDAITAGSTCSFSAATGRMPPMSCDSRMVQIRVRHTTSATGAVGVVFGLMAIIQAFGFMFGHGAGSNISRLLGAHEKERAKAFSATGFYLAVGASVLIAIIGILDLNGLCRLLGSTETILPYARIYAFYILVSAPAMASGCVMNNVLRYEGYANLAMVGLVSGGILNMAMPSLCGA